MNPKKAKKYCVPESAVLVIVPSIRIVKNGETRELFPCGPFNNLYGKDGAYAYARSLRKTARERFKNKGPDGTTPKVTTTVCWMWQHSPFEVINNALAGAPEWGDIS